MSTFIITVSCVNTILFKFITLRSLYWEFAGRRAFAMETNVHVGNVWVRPVISFYLACKKVVFKMVLPICSILDLAFCAHFWTGSLAPDGEFFNLTGDSEIKRSTLGSKSMIMPAWPAHRFFGKGLDIDVDICSMILIRGCLYIPLEVPEEGSNMRLEYVRFQHLA